MADESIIALKRTGFPKESFDEKSYKTVIEYVGDAATLKAASPILTHPWGDYLGIATVENFELIEGTTYGILTVTCERKFEPGTSGTKRDNETTYEIDWADVQRSMFEHPEFAIGEGGTYELSSQDIAAIESWKINPDVDYKKDYIYRTDGDYSKGVSALDETLSSHAKMFARGIQLGIEHWVEKVPVAIQTDTYVNGPPPAGTAGLKEDPIGFPNLPEGYEWIKDAQSGLRAGGQSSWSDKQTWLGAKKVLVDAENIYWAAP